MMPRMGKTKVNLEFSLSVMLTNKCCVDLFVYSALSINDFQFFTEYKHVKNRSNERKGFLSYDQLVGCCHSNISNKHITVTAYEQNMYVIQRLKVFFLITPQHIQTSN